MTSWTSLTGCRQSMAGFAKGSGFSASALGPAVSAPGEFNSSNTNGIAKHKAAATHDTAAFKNEIAPLKPTVSCRHDTAPAFTRQGSAIGNEPARLSRSDKPTDNGCNSSGAEFAPDEISDEGPCAVPVEPAQDAQAWQQHDSSNGFPYKGSTSDLTTPTCGKTAAGCASDSAPHTAEANPTGGNTLHQYESLDLTKQQEVQTAKFRQAEIERGAANDLHIRDVYFALAGRESYAIDTNSRIKALREEAFLRTEQSDFIGRQMFARNWELRTDRMVFAALAHVVQEDIGCRENARALLACAGADQCSSDDSPPEQPITQPAARNKEGFAVPGITRLDRAGETRVVRRVEVHYVSAEHGYMSRETGILDISSDVYVAGSLIVMPGIEASTTRR